MRITRLQLSEMVLREVRRIAKVQRYVELFAADYPNANDEKIEPAIEFFQKELVELIARVELEFGLTKRARTRR